jgi:hypothetical protein
MTTKQIKALITDIETKTDKNGNPYYRISLQGIFATYFYVFSNSVEANILQLLQAPHNLVNNQVLISYIELPNKNGEGVFNRVKDLQII